MKDKISEQRIELLHPKARKRFKDFIEEIEVFSCTTFRIVEGFRSYEDQAKIYAKGRTAPGPIVSYAPPMLSWHNYGLAIDIVELKDGKLNWSFDYKSIEPISIIHALTWGGRFVVKSKPFPDYPHYQLTFGHTIRELFDLYKQRKFISGTDYIDI